MPHACIGVDVIVGFPGETDEDFLETYNFLNEMDISYLHVFTYSERDNTEAAEMNDVVPMNVRNKRSKMLRGLSVKKRRAFYESQIGTDRTVLFESENKEGYIHGFTENYVKVKTPWNPELVNTLLDIQLTHIDEDGSVRLKFQNEKSPVSYTHLDVYKRQNVDSSIAPPCGFTTGAATLVPANATLGNKNPLVVELISIIALGAVSYTHLDVYMRQVFGSSDS